ncbi:membrane protein insertase YidC [Marinicella rhabdoformis]|uniref:membrane protein insertase YidC n=1 Tax=Marinicella rhabdoformis TaxID=2580566 RepID=UPI0012AEDE7F|nr:membrane protein insertase YidC [Marinicella rhabdoformis]
MNNTKNIYLIAMMFLAFLLYVEWQKDYPQQPTETVAQTNEVQTTSIPGSNEPAVVNNQEDVPRLTQSLSSSDTPQVSVNNTKTQIITELETPLLKLKFAAKGAAVVYAELKNYPVEKGATENVVLFDYLNNPYQAESGLVSETANFSHNTVFSALSQGGQLNNGETVLVFKADTAQGVVEKSYTIKADSYAIAVTQKVTNNTSSDWLMTEYNQLKRSNAWLGNDAGFTDSSRYSFKGAAYFDSEDGYEKLDFEDLEEEQVKTTLTTDAWVGMVQHYFMSAIIPDADQIEVQTEYKNNTNMPYLIRYLTPQKTVQAGGSQMFESTLYVGPKLQKELPEINKGLDLTVDYGVMTAIAKPLFWVLDKIHGLVGNWGWSIILLTVLIKLMFFKLSEAQYKSMAKMRKLQPRITTLKARYKDDKQKFNQEMMGLYQKEKVNPMGGCLPILVQIPVFIALYWVLLESVELRQAPFMLWLQDLSSPDPYFILPAINAAAMIMTQRLSPTPGMDPMQQKIMKFMPVAFSVMFAFFQSGLVLYWAVNSVLSLAQQWFITKRIDAQDTAVKV